MAGDEVNFTVVPEGGDNPYTYQWQKKDTAAANAWVDIDGTVNPTALTANLKLQNAGHSSIYVYRVKVTDHKGASAISTECTLDVDNMPNSFTIAAAKADGTAAPADTQVTGSYSTGFIVTAKQGDGDFRLTPSGVPSGTVLGELLLDNSSEATDVTLTKVSGDHWLVSPGSRAGTNTIKLSVANLPELKITCAITVAA